MIEQNPEKGFCPITYCLIKFFLIMKIFRNLIAFFGFLVTVYSCEPNQLPTEKASTFASEIDAGAEASVTHNGDKDDETIGSHDD